MRVGKILLLAATVLIAGVTMKSPVMAHPFAINGLHSPAVAAQVQYSREQSRAISRCMRRKYGPRYRRIKTTSQFFLMQACT